MPLDLRHEAGWSLKGRIENRGHHLADLWNRYMKVVQGGQRSPELEARLKAAADALDKAQRAKADVAEGLFQEATDRVLAIDRELESAEGTREGTPEVM